MEALEYSIGGDIFNAENENTMLVVYNYGDTNNEDKEKQTQATGCGWI
ncbi:MAG TPA: hypothetical protein VFN35_02935 [Ktedonobacteraceae bacterium]|nr:hypothetical protein [Ktedonobacteraceae bacterium]